MTNKTKTMKLTDYITQYLVGKGIEDAFMIVGGGVMHLVDSVGKQKGLNYTCTHHEQAAAIAAEGYYRASGKTAAVVVTSGPGGTDTITGLLGAWLDSAPVIFLSGQVKRETTIECCREIGLRQLGDQEINIVDVIRPLTKYAAVVDDPLDIKRHLDQAFQAAHEGRPGPVWLDLPLDIQGKPIEVSKLRKTRAPKKKKDFSQSLKTKMPHFMKMLSRSKRPVLLVGQGVRISGAEKAFRELIKVLKIPVLTSFNGFDLLETKHPQFMGHPGTLGSRYANFTLQNADLLICVGTRNNIRQISYAWQGFAKNAKKVVVDIDPKELRKPTLKPDLGIPADAGDFLLAATKAVRKTKRDDSKWLKWCAVRKKKYPVVLEKYRKAKRKVNPYYFFEVLTDELNKNAVVVTGDGTACVVMFQAGSTKKGQRVFWNSGCASMGYDLPAAIGAAVALPGKDVVCVAGDGSLQMNIQEIETLIYQKLPVKLLVLNNDGYASIKQTQTSFFEGRRVGCDPKSGVGFPNMSKLAKAYGLPVLQIKNHSEMRSGIRKFLNRKGPVFCEVFIDPSQEFSPRLKSEKKPDGSIVSKPLEDMYPFLSSEELADNMIVK